MSKEKICSITSKLIVEKKAEKLKLSIDEIKPGSYFYQVYREKNWVDTTLGRPRNNSTIDTKKLSTKQNIRYIDYLTRTNEICDIAIQKFENSADIEKSLTIQQIKIITHEWDAVLNIAEDPFNEKTKIPLNMRHIILLEVTAASSITKVGEIF